MPAFFYLGETCKGAVLKRSSTRNDFKVAAVFGEQTPGVLVDIGSTVWSTSVEQLRRNATYRYYAPKGMEVVTVRLVERREYDAAVKAATPENLVRQYRPTAKLKTVPKVTGSTRWNRFMIVDGDEALSPECVDRVSAWRHAASHLGL